MQVGPGPHLGCGAEPGDPARDAGGETPLPEMRAVRDLPQAFSTSAGGRGEGGRRGEGRGGDGGERKGGRKAGESQGDAEMMPGSPLGEQVKTFPRGRSVSA